MSETNCKHYFKPKLMKYPRCNSSYRDSNYCEHNPDCYYKQLQTLKARVKELEQENFTLKEHQEVEGAIFSEIERYKQALREIKGLGPISYEWEIGVNIIKGVTELSSPKMKITKLEDAQEIAKQALGSEASDG